MVIDASIGVKWLVLEPDTDAANRLIVDGVRLIVPMLFHAEVGNALWKKARRKEIAVEVVSQLLVDVQTLVEGMPEQSIMPRALAMATELDHPIYDCVYLALAEEQGVEVVTADARFICKVRGSPFDHLVSEL